MNKCGIIFVIFYFVLSSSIFAQGKLNELTKSNMSFRKGYTTDSFRENDKKFRDRDKAFSTDNYYDSKKNFYDAQKRVDNNSTFYDAQKRAGGLDGSYRNQGKSQIDNKSRFYDENKELFFDNKERDLSRGYQGKADLSKRNDMGDSIETMYEDLMDKSMSDINKYHSQSSREDSRDAGIPVASTLEQKESSILDLLNFSDKKIDNSSVKFSLPRSMENMAGLSSGSSEQAYRDAAAANKEMQDSRGQSSSRNSNSQALDYSKPQEGTKQTALSKDSKSKPSNPYQKQTVTVDKPVKEGEQRSIFGVPRELNSGKVQITVEVKPNK